MTATLTTPKANEITNATCQAVANAILGKGPRVDRATYRAHVPKFVTKTGELVGQAEPEPLSALSALYAECAVSPEFQPLIAAYRNGDFKVFSAEVSRQMGDFDPEIDEHVGTPNGVVDRFYTEVFEGVKNFENNEELNYKPQPVVAILIGQILAEFNHLAPVWTPPAYNWADHN